VTGTARVVGADTVTATLRQAADKLGDLTATNVKVGQLVSSEARQSAPRLTGALAASTVGFSDKTTAGVGSDLVYAPVIHNGWSAHRIDADPYITRAFESTEQRWVKLFDQAAADAAGTVKGA
jgi:hypothetical protein